MRPDDPVGADVQRLLGLPLRLLGTVRRNPHHRGDGRRNRARLRDLPPVEHVLQRVAQRPNVVGIVLHLEDDAVVFGGPERERGLRIGRRKGGECVLALFQGPDHTVKTRNISHRFPMR
jgi:hypothetical protein